MMMASHPSSTTTTPPHHTTTMTTQATRTNNAISLKGSTKIVTEFFEYSVNSILYQRNVYPADDFRMVKKYGLPMLITSDESLKAYLDTILKQVHGESRERWRNAR